MLQEQLFWNNRHFFNQIRPKAANKRLSRRGSGAESLMHVLDFEDKPVQLFSLLKWKENIYSGWVLSGLTLPSSSWPSYLSRLCRCIFIPHRVAESWLSIWISPGIRCMATLNHQGQRWKQTSAASKETFTQVSHLKTGKQQSTSVSAFNAWKHDHL